MVAEFAEESAPTPDDAFDVEINAAQGKQPLADKFH
jgi:hypothetical protein